MELDLNKCPECGYVSNSQPDVCPQCGCDLAAHREKLRAEMARLQKEAAEKAAAEKIESEYKAALDLFSKNRYKEAIVAFLALGDYKESEGYVEKSRDALYHAAVEKFMANDGLATLLANTKSDDAKALAEDASVEDKKAAFKSMSEEQYTALVKDFEELKGYRDTARYIACCNQAIENLKRYAEEKDYELAKKLFLANKYKEAKKLFDAMTHIPDAAEQAKKCEEANSEKEAEELKIKREAAARAAKINKIETILQYVAFLAPLVMSIVFAIILFSNSTQIRFYGSYAGLAIGWGFFLIFSIICAIVVFKLRKNLGSHKTQRIAASIIGAIVLVASIVVLAESASLESDFGPQSLVSISITGKKNDVQYHNTTTLYFTIENKSDRDLSSIHGDLTFYDEDDYAIAVYSVQLQGPFTPGETKISLRIDNPKGDIYYSDLSDLTAKFTPGLLYIGSSTMGVGDGYVDFSGEDDMDVSIQVAA